MEFLISSSHLIIFIIPVSKLKTTQRPNKIKIPRKVHWTFFNQIRLCAMIYSTHTVFLHRKFKTICNNFYSTEGFTSDININSLFRKAINSKHASNHIAFFRPYYNFQTYTVNSIAPFRNAIKQIINMIFKQFDYIAF